VRKGGGSFGDRVPLADGRRLDAVKAVAVELAEACRELKLESARVELSAAVLLRGRRQPRCGAVAGQSVHHREK